MTIEWIRSQTITIEWECLNYDSRIRLFFGPIYNPIGDAQINYNYRIKWGSDLLKLLLSNKAWFPVYNPNGDTQINLSFKWGFSA